MLHEVVLAARRLAKSRTFSATVILTLALGIGANTAMFSVLDGILLRPLPFHDPETLVEIRTVNRGGAALTSQNYDAFVRWREQRDVFASFEGYSSRPMVLLGADEPVSINVAAITGGMMGMLRVTPARGRAIEPGDAEPASNRVLVLSDALWRRRFGGDPNVVGRVIRLDDGAYEIVGVMPASFKFPRTSTEAWTGLAVTSARPVAAGGTARPSGYNTVARLAPGVSFPLAQERVTALTPAFAKTMPRGDGWRLEIGRLDAHRANSGERQALWIFFAAVSLLLVIACANVANLLLTRGAERAREVAIRAALGASRTRLIRELFTETALLSLAGGALGVALAYTAVDVFVANAPRDLTFLSLNTLAIDRRVLAFATTLTLAAAFVFGMLPAIRSSKQDVLERLQSSSPRATASRAQRRFAGAVVIAEIALSLALLVGAGLLIRTFAYVTSIDPGFNPRHLTTYSMELPAWKYVSTASAARFWSELTERVAAVPGVTGVTVTPGLPPTGGGIMFDLRIEAEGNPEIVQDRELLLPTANVRPEYFQVLGIPIGAGRAFSSEDTPGSPRAIILSDALARRMWPNRSPIGGRIRFDAELAGTAGDKSWYTVVGVAGNVYQFDRSERRDRFAVYFAASQGPAGLAGRYQTLAVRTIGDGTARINDIRAVFRGLEPDQPIMRIETIEQAYAQFFGTPRFYALLMTVFAAIGVMLAAIGLYGVIAHTTTQRTSEFGIRVALGAARRDIALLVLRQGLVLAVAGIVLGAAGAAASAGAMRRMLIGVTPSDPATFVIVALTLAGAALIASWVPARRALRIDPVVALRHD